MLANANGETQDQISLRDELISLTGAHHSNPDDFYSNMIWCPITSRYQEKAMTVACRILPKKFEHVYSLSSTENGIVMLDIAEKAFDEHAWTFVPDEDEEGEGYRVLVLEPENYWMRGGVGGMRYDGKSEERKRLRDVIEEKKKVEFSSLHRPRKEMLYLHFCCAMMKKFGRIGEEMMGGGWGKKGKLPKIFRFKEGVAMMEEMVRGLTRNGFEMRKEWDEEMAEERRWKAWREVRYGEKHESRVVTRPGRAYTEPVPYRSFDIDSEGLVSFFDCRGV